MKKEESKKGSNDGLAIMLALLGGGKRIHKSKNKKEEPTKKCPHCGKEI